MFTPRRLRRKPQIRDFAGNERDESAQAASPFVVPELVAHEELDRLLAEGSGPAAVFSLPCAAGDRARQRISAAPASGGVEVAGMKAAARRSRGLLGDGRELGAIC
ncbi:hypothetical protein, partial [Polyangium jinanense]